MGKRVWAVFIKKTLLGLFIIFIAGMLYDRFTNYPEFRAPLTAGIISVGLYLALSTAMALLNAICDAIYLWLFAEGDLSGAVLEELHARKIPAPGAHDPKNFDYLAILADDEDAEASDRVKAAFVFGSYKAVMGNSIFKALAFRKGIDAAMLRYVQEAPQTR